MILTAEKIIEMGMGSYTKPRQLPDGTWCCLGKMLFTTGIIVDVTDQGYDHRFCFDHYQDAARELEKMTHIDSEPQGYIVRK